MADAMRNIVPYSRDLDRSLNHSGEHKDARLLIVDDEPMNVLMLVDMLEQAGYSNIKSTTDPCETVELFCDYHPALVLLDLMMPVMDGAEVMDRLHATDNGGTPIMILILTADISPQTKRQALACGAKDFLTKPFDAVEMLLRIENLLEMHFLQLDLQKRNRLLDSRVKERTADLELARQKSMYYAHQVEEAQNETLDRLARAGEFRDDSTGLHTQRVAETTGRIAKRLGFPVKKMTWLRQAARLHDVGKIGVSDEILLKKSRLTEDEFAVMKTHTTIGAELLKGGKSELYQMAHRIAANHHERWDGTGYPLGLSKEDIPIEARILSIADVFDALTHVRPYKESWPVDKAVAEIERQSGGQFDPRIVTEFLRLPHNELL